VNWISFLAQASQQPFMLTTRYILPNEMAAILLRRVLLIVIGVSLTSGTGNRMVAMVASHPFFCGFVR
jgi:hypothetical protein